MALEGKGRIFRRTDGKYFVYLPKSVVEDSAFPFKMQSSSPVRVIADLKEGRVLIAPEEKKRNDRKGH